MPSQVPGNKMGIQDSVTSFSPLPFPSSALHSHQQHLQFWDCCVLLGVHGLAQVFCLLVITSVNHASSCLHFCPCVCSWLFLSIPAQAIITSHFHAHSDGHYKPWRYWFELHFFFTPLQPCPPGTCHSRSYLNSRVFYYYYYCLGHGSILLCYDPAAGTDVHACPSWKQRSSCIADVID